MEIARQFGLPFMLAELVFILSAIDKGFSLKSIFIQNTICVKWLAGLFLGTYWIGSIFYSEMAVLSFIYNIFFVVHVLFAYAVAQTIGCFKSDDLDRTAKNLVIGLFIFCLMTAYALIFHPPFSSMPKNEIIWQFAIPGFISLRLFGAFCGAIFCFILGVLFLADEQKRLNGWHILWLTLSAGMMIWSGTRAAVFGSMVTLVLVVAVYRVRPTLRAFLWILASLFIAAILAISLVPYGDPNFLLYTTGDGASAETVSGGRLSYWVAAWKAYQQVPVFGAGPFASQFLIEKGQQIHVQPHNIVLQFLITWGFFATIFALALLTIASWKAHIVALRHRIVLPFLMLLDCLLAMSWVDGMTHFAQHVMLIMIGFGVIFGYDRAFQKVLTTEKVASS